MTVYAILPIPSTALAATNGDLSSLSAQYRATPLKTILRNSTHPQSLTFMGKPLSGFWADQSSLFQQKIDRGYELILATPTGLKLLRDLKFSWTPMGKAIAEECRPDRVRIQDRRSPIEIAQSNLDDYRELAKQLNFFWGMSLPLAQKITDVPQTSEQIVGSRSVSLRYSDGRTVQLFPKRYFFSRDVNRTQIDSYTAADNKTIAIIGDTQDPDAELIGVLTHEAMITGDAKASLVDWAARRRYRDLNQWQTKLSDPAFNSILATMRAFRAETQVMSEISELTQTTANPWSLNPQLRPYLAMTAQSCVDEYQKILKAKYLTGLGLSAQDRSELLLYLEPSSTLTRCDGTRENACLELIGIEAGARVTNSSGPRPRVGSGW